MEDWLYYSLSIALCLALSRLLSTLRLRAPAAGKPAVTTAAPPPSLPPGPTALTALGPLLMLAWTSVNIESVVRVARAWYGPIFTLYILPSFPVVFVADRDVARRVLVQRGSAFANRPPANFATRIFSSDQHNITAGAYGPLWRTLRSNLSARILHPSIVRRYAPVRRRAASDLVAGITRQQSQMREADVVILGLLHQAIFHVLITMCFGEGLGDAAVAAVTALQREFLIASVGFQVFGAGPAVTKLLFWRRFNRMMDMRRRHEELFIPLIRARRARLHDGENSGGVEDVADYCYVDSLLGLRVPEDGGGGTRKLTEMEIVSMCTEFLSGPADSTVTVMQWAMANLVARPEIQAKLRDEIHHVAGGPGACIQDEHLQRMPYLRAVVLEALRRHPPNRFIMPHATSEDGGAELDGYSVPAHASVNFALGFMAMDPAVWRDPERFRPERFLPGGEGEDVDITGSREIKMMPFGAGRRMCPGIDLSLLHIQYFVANMVSEFQWTEVPGEPVDFADKLELTMVMRRPLRARVAPVPCC